MSNSLGEAVLDLSADSGGLERSIEGSKSGVLSAMNKLGFLGGQILVAAIAAVVAGSVLIANALKTSVQAAMEAEEVQAQLNAVLKSTGGIAGVTADEVNNLADSLSQVTKFDDEAIVSAESLLLTFTKIGSDIFPQATETVLNMSEAFDQDLKSSAIQLGKALQDPIAGIGALARIGVQFSEEQQEMIETMVEAGDIAGAQAIIMKELETQVGGAARAAGETFGGQLAILQTRLGNIKEQIGTALLPVLGQLAAMFSDYLSRPEVQAFLQELASNIADLAAKVAENLPIFIANVQEAFGWFEEHKGEVVAALAVIGVAIMAFVYTVVIPAAISAIAALWPILLIMAAVAAVAWLVYEAWTNNWGGIRDALIELWTVIQPYLQILIDFLGDLLTSALQTLSNTWTNVLLPAIQTFFAWVAAVVIPAIIRLIEWLAVNVPAGINKLVTWWKTLQAAVALVWDTIVKKVKANISLLINGFTNLMARGEGLINWIKSNFANAFAAAGAAVRKVVGFVQNLINKLKELAEKMPAMLTPGSPTPFEMGLRGIGDAMEALSKMSVPSLSSSLNANLGGGASAMNMPLAGDEGFAGGSRNTYVFNMQKSDLNEDQLKRALQRAEMLYG